MNVPHEPLESREDRWSRIIICDTIPIVPVYDNAIHRRMRIIQFESQWYYESTDKIGGG